MQHWIGRKNSYISGYTTDAREQYSDFLQCLPYCASKGRPSVDISSGNYGTCHCNTVNTTEQSLSSSSGYIFYEDYCQSKYKNCPQFNTVVKNKQFCTFCHITTFPKLNPVCLKVIFVLYHWFQMYKFIYQSFFPR